METIGKGSFGKVIKAKDLISDSLCAVKVIKKKKKFVSQLVNL
jgi:serine/threonine protein kinase